MILLTALEILGKELGYFIATQLPAGYVSFPVFIENRQQESADASTSDEGVIISLIRIEEERTLLNNSGKRRVLPTGQVAIQRPNLHVNLYLLVSTRFQQYDNSLRALSYALEFFHTKPVFSAQNLLDTTPLDDLTTEQKSEFLLDVELHSLSYEQTNYVWSSLGGQQGPHFVLKARLIQIIPQQIASMTTPIREIQSQETIE